MCRYQLRPAYFLGELCRGELAASAVHDADVVRDPFPPELRFINAGLCSFACGRPVTCYGANRRVTGTPKPGGENWPRRRLSADGAF
jgi:hypothetical protein